ncbi:MAG TPA: lysophospholipid acyltransferase family protein [Thermoanaerobaculia bacterium]|nr:lysophospholipid acyltransferase family protein [Thermoanaerobaculia bacterium]
MFRSIRVVLTLFLATAIVAPLVTLVGSLRSTSPLIDRLIRLWASSIVRAAGLRVEATGMEKLKSDQRYIFICNHTSYLDIPCLLTVVPQPLRFLAKKSLFQVPVFGWGLKAAGFIPIDRKDRSSAVKSFDLAAERIRKGNSILVFPEEGRSASQEMRPFKRGAFLLALKSGLPIVPMVLEGTYEALPVGRFKIKHAKIHVTVSDPINTADLSIRQKDELIDAARGVIEGMLKRPLVESAQPS